ncbi:uncharacterized protein TNCV_4304021 [Trichonephila clavipes]|nr:uncharacterized protein TNCV_4304021 [Trichonephila clavipes]
MMWFVREEFSSGTTESLVLYAPGISGRPLSIQLHPASGSKRVPRGSKVAGEVPGGTAYNFQNAAAKCMCDDYFHKEIDSQLGDGNRYTMSLWNLESL